MGAFSLRTSGESDTILASSTPLEWMTLVWYTECHERPSESLTTGLDDWPTPRRRETHCEIYRWRASTRDVWYAGEIADWKQRDQGLSPKAFAPQNSGP